MKYILLFLVLTNHFSTFANSIIKGKIEDKKHCAIQWANIALYNDSTFIKGTISDQNGYFMFENTKTANKIIVTSVGYKEYSNSIPNDGDLGIITLTEDIIALQEVVVKGNLPITRISGNAVITNVENSIMSKLGTVKDVLKKTPLVIENNDSFIVFGRGIPKIYINGKLIHDKTDLEQISSEDIKSIEVISNPGSQYSSDTNAVINIKTIKPKGEGISISFDNASKFTHYISNSNNCLFKYRKKNLEVFINGYFDGGKRQSDETNSITTYTKEIFEQNLENHVTKSFSEYYAKMGFNYQLGEKHSFGMFYKTGRSKIKEKDTSNTDIIVNNMLDNNLFQKQEVVNFISPNYEGNIYYIGNIGKLSIKLNSDFMHKEVNKNNKQCEYNKTSKDEVKTDVVNRSKFWAEKLIFSYPLWKGSLHLGEEFTNSHAYYLSKYEGVDIPDGDTHVKENNLTTFFDITQTFGKVQIGIGARLEHVRYCYFNKGIFDEKLSRNYNNWFPNFSIASQLGDLGLSFNLTTRTQRPSYRQLEGTLNYVNQYSYQTGNPSLKPVKKYTAQLLAHWHMFFVQAIYNYEKDAIFYKTSKYYDSPYIKVVSFENVPQFRQLQFALGVQYNSKKWTTQPTIGFFNNYYEGEFLNKKKKFNHPFFFLSYNNNIKLPHNWNLNADFMIQTAGNIQNCYVKTISYFNIDIQRSFFNKKMTFHLKINDLFDTNNERIILYNGDIKVDTNNYTESRNVVATLRYKFNTTKSKYKGTGAGIDEKKRF